MSEQDTLLWDVRKVAAVCGLSVRTVWSFADSGRMPGPLHIGGARRWSADSIRAWVAQGCPNVRTAKAR